MASLLAQFLGGGSYADDAKRISKATTLQEINDALESMTVQKPVNIDRVMELANAKRQEILAKGAVPTAMEAQRLNTIAATDPTVGNPEGLADFAARPDFWLGTQPTAVIPTGKKGATPVSDVNPYTAGVVTDFARGNLNLRDTLMAAQDPMAAARVAQSKELSGQFRDTQQGRENLVKADAALRDYAAYPERQKALGEFRTNEAALYQDAAGVFGPPKPTPIAMGELTQFAGPLIPENELQRAQQGLSNLGKPDPMEMLNARMEALFALQSQRDEASERREDRKDERQQRTFAQQFALLDRSAELREKAANNKRLTPTAIGDLTENDKNLNAAKFALGLAEGKTIDGIKGDKSATGWKGLLPDFVLQRLDREGVDTRASVANIGSLTIRDRSGAAVTAAEFPRLRPFIPSETDKPDVVRKKLKQFVREFEREVNNTRNYYTESGYKVPAGQKPRFEIIQVK